MKISGVTVTPVNVPLEAPIRWAWGVRSVATRNIVQVDTDDGLQGLGETMGGEEIASMIRSLGRRILGDDPFNLERILQKAELLPYWAGYAGLAAIGGVEMALWDLKGKAVNQPLSSLLGGGMCSEVPFSAYVFPRYPGEGGVGGESTPDELLRFCTEVVARYGFRVLKVKGGVFPPETDLEVIKVLRQHFGSQVQLRLDPNAAWTPQTALRIAKKLEVYDLEYLEDPTWGIEGMARLRRDVAIPFATNMCVVTFEDIPDAIRLGAVDMILGDCHKWGGIWATKKLAAVCETFQLGMSLHSGVELGISTAANLHLAASTPQIRMAIDGHYHHQMDDIIAGGKFPYVNGCMRVLQAPGLGIAVDAERFGRYAERHREEGTAASTFDPHRPDWIPGRALW